MYQNVKHNKHGSHLVSYQIVERGKGEFSFAEREPGVSGIVITDNAAIYGSVPLIPGKESLGIGELKVEIMALDSSRDYNFNHYRIKGEIPGLEGDDYTLTVKAYGPLEPREKERRVDGLLEDTPIEKGGFVPTDPSFFTFRAGKDAELFELEIYHEQTLAARTPKLALPGYKLELARKALPEGVKGLEYRPQELVEIKATGPALFGTSGVRGKIGYVLTAETVKATSQATVEYIQREGIKGPMIVGGDTRFLSEDFAKTAAEVFAGNAEVFRGDGYNGPVVIFIDTDGKPFVPTPLMTFAIRKFRGAGGVTMTASHNFAEDNGYKSLRGIYGGLAPQEVTDSLQERANALLKHNPTIKMLPFDRGLEIGLIEKRDLRPAYFEEHLMKLVDFDIIRQSKPVVAVDFLYGTAIGFLDQALELAGCRIAKRFHDWRDRDFGGRRPDCEDPDNIRDMIDYVAATPEVDVGLSVDSDSDRFGIVSKKGLVNANHILAMLFYYLHRVKGEQGKVCRTIVTTHLLDVMAQKWGVELVEIPRIGFKWIGDLMNDEGESFILAGEESSGLSRGNFPEKDGSLADLLVLEMMCKIGQLEMEAGKRDRPIKPLHEILEELQAEFGPWHCHRLDLYGVQRKQKIMDFFRKEYQPRPEADLTIAGLKVHKTNVTAPVFDAAGQPIVDGVKYFLEPHDPEKGIIAGITTHVRESGNEPVIRIYTQHHTDRNKLEEIEQTIARLIREVDEG
jgi:alpha-D-glucose phosphate-specific phosphoglucomutase